MSTELINRIVLSIGAAFWAVLAGFCGLMGADSSSRLLNGSVLILGTVTGVMVGFLVTPEADEQKNFAAYSKSLFTLLTGYLAGKLDPAISGFVQHMPTQPIAGFRVIVCVSAFILAVIATFIVRRYPL
jgi:ABC-type lipoprotein release transport system permease subunit